MMNLKTTGEYPCELDDLIDEKRRTYATIYTLKNAREDSRKAETGITKKKDGIFDIVIDTPKLTKKRVRDALKELSRITKIEYKLLNQK